jgi:hypothetical protein
MKDPFLQSIVPQKWTDSIGDIQPDTIRTDVPDYLNGLEDR